MKHSNAIILLLAFLLPACGKQDSEGAATSPPVSVPEQAVSEAPAPAASVKQDAAGAPATRPAPETASPPVVAGPQAVPDEPAAPVVSARPAKPAAPAASGAVPGRDEGLALAQQSGCLACHKIETKLVGPAWQDVSKKYKGDAGARARLIAKVKAGGKGNWTEITGGVMMPPYSPRVSDADIERLVSFVLSL